MNHILFIGNSHTYLHYMPLMLTELAKAGGHAVHTTQATGEGASLSWHWANAETRKTLADGGWTHVVLQERSRGPLEDLTSMYHHARLFDGEIRSLNARAVFYMTWPAKENPQDQAVIAEAYETIGRECRGLVAPVGRAWQIIKSVHPDVPLYHRDGRHAGKAGAYLAACVFYDLLYGWTPEGLPGQLSHQERILANFDEDLARAFQQAANEAVKGSSGICEDHRHCR